jgi:hypothetical protein
MLTTGKVQADTQEVERLFEAAKAEKDREVLKGLIKRAFDPGAEDCLKPDEVSERVGLSRADGEAQQGTECCLQKLCIVGGEGQYAHRPSTGGMARHCRGWLTACSCCYRQGIEFLSAEIGESTAALPAIAKELAEAVGYQKLALQMIGAMKCPISRKKQALSWEEIQAEVQALRAELKMKPLPAPKGAV